ncbi:hypothetical protein [Hymenobacter volaticus]|uniref:Uncharacterized protein n=1 Tax=Hymenobacter volaticus TaxID=2932254 RepID=A0ABY4G9P3_9BACT|nr:hypothetical protein [Hymenobacter volaticus]UOQ67635.1 hypothetical protein MUN86_07160 [Hymenobacter volaticus]
MSDISEICYCAGWLLNLEYVLWNAVLTGPRKCGHGMITQEDIHELLALANRTDSWMVFDEETEETALALSFWRAKYLNDISLDSTLIKG